MTTLTAISNADANQLSYVAMDAILFVVRHASDIERIAERFCHYDMADAMKLCMENGMNNLLMDCDMDDKIAAMEEEGHEVQ